MKKYKVKPLKKKIKHTVFIPGSKSITNRALLLAILAKGNSCLKNILISDDTEYMLEAAQKLGINLTINENNNVFIEGTAGNFPNKKDLELYLGNAGTAVRFLTAAMILRPAKTIITGNKRMQERPILNLINGIKELSIKIESNGSCPPLTIYGSQNIKNKTSMKGDKSSQYFSALMQVGSYFPQGLKLLVEGDLVKVAIVLGEGDSNLDQLRFIIETLYDREIFIEEYSGTKEFFLNLDILAGEDIQKLSVYPIFRNSDGFTYSGDLADSYTAF